MSRWDPDADGRLQQSAMKLYLERGYAGVTVADIAAAAGLTKRTFFRYFADKREVLFAGAQTFQAHVTAAVRGAPAHLAPIEVAVTALAHGGAHLTEYGQYARARRDLIASSAELQERELIKMAALTTAIAEALRERGTGATKSNLTAKVAVTTFIDAYDRWIDSDGAADLQTLIEQSLDDLRTAIEAA